jgi:hypothetical protein
MLISEVGPQTPDLNKCTQVLTWHRPATPWYYPSTLCNKLSYLFRIDLFVDFADWIQTLSESKYHFFEELRALLDISHHEFLEGPASIQPHSVIVQLQEILDPLERHDWRTQSYSLSDLDRVGVEVILCDYQEFLVEGVSLGFLRVSIITFI